MNKRELTAALKNAEDRVNSLEEAIAEIERRPTYEKDAAVRVLLKARGEYEQRMRDLARTVESTVAIRTVRLADKAGRLQWEIDKLKRAIGKLERENADLRAVARIKRQAA